VATLIREETGTDSAAIAAVVEAAFGRPEEADLVAALRVQDALTISLVAERSNALVGHIAFSPITVEANPHDLCCLGLAPLAVAPHQQGRGIGGRLIKAGLAAAAGWDLVFVLGDPGYYERFGFEVAQRHGLACEYEAPPEAFRVLELRPGALAAVSGTARYNEAFAEV
jgi:putative acetyltransferase|tara:strand:- start:85 stop:591 length:507 start_codon:yes stop_codon:yes gene_type:complete